MEKKISEIKKEFETAGTEKLSELFVCYADDSRVGVSGLIKQYKRKLEKLEQERARHLPEDTPCRFDVVGITGKEISLVKDSF